MSALASSSPTSSPSQSPPNESKQTNIDEKGGKLQIFLGGSCNPTTWRQNVAIPYLETNGISYYNPQVENWTPESVNSERYAKQNAQILLFVIDRQTRSTVSLVESAFMAGENKNLVLVIYPLEYNIVSSTDSSKKTSNIYETSSKLMKTSRISNNQNNREASFMKSSSSSSKSLSTLISSSSIAHESDLTSTATLASTTTTLTSSKISNTKTRSNISDLDRLSLGETCKEAVRTSETVKMSGEVISSGEFQELKQARSLLQNLVAVQRIPLFSDILQALKFAHSSCLSDGTVSPSNKQALICCKHLTPSISNQSSNFQLDHEEFNQNTTAIDQKSANDVVMKDVYLSFDNDDQISAGSTVISILKEKGLTYNYMSVNTITKPSHIAGQALNVQNFSIDSQTTATTATSNEMLTRYSDALNTDGNETKLAIEREICAIKSSRVLLFVITNKCRGLSIMVLASHFMALFRNNVVLCVQYLEEPCSIDGETLTKTAIADYNRGRVYLNDYATKSQVPVFSTIREAIECCSRKCRYNKN